MGGGAALRVPVTNHHIPLPNPPGFRVSGLRASPEVIYHIPNISALRVRETFRPLGLGLREIRADVKHWLLGIGVESRDGVFRAMESFVFSV